MFFCGEIGRLSGARDKGDDRVQGGEGTTVERRKRLNMVWRKERPP